jgi:hypothetical protein
MTITDWTIIVLIVGPLIVAASHILETRKFNEHIRECEWATERATRTANEAWDFTRILEENLKTLPEMRERAKNGWPRITAATAITLRISPDMTCGGGS